jgi:hypothetical protein
MWRMGRLDAVLTPALITAIAIGAGGCGGGSSNQTATQAGTPAGPAPLSTIKSRLKAAGYTVNRFKGQSLEFNVAPHQTARAADGLGINTPRGSLYMLVLPGTRLRTKFVTFVKSPPAVPTEVIGDHVWVANPAGGGGLGPKNAAYFRQVVKKGEG